MPAGLAFTPDCGQTAAGRLYNCPAEDEMRTALQKAIDNADYECGRRMNELDFATAFASPVKVAKKRAGAFNTVRLSSAARCGSWTTARSTSTRCRTRSSRRS